MRLEFLDRFKEFFRGQLCLWRKELKGETCAFAVQDVVDVHGTNGVREPEGDALRAGLKYL